MTDPTDGFAPIVVDMGKVKRKAIKKLKRGRGKLIDETREVIAEVEAHLGDEAEGKELLPVIILFEKKRKKRRRRPAGVFPFFG